MKCLRCLGQCHKYCYIIVGGKRPHHLQTWPGSRDAWNFMLFDSLSGPVTKTAPIVPWQCQNEDVTFTVADYWLFFTA